MPDPMPVLQPPAKINYRPISGVAIAALLIAVGYALVVSVAGLTAFLSRTPILLGVWTLLVPAGAAVLALVARRQIRTAEDTRSGLALARWALRLSIFFGIGFAAVYGGTYVAIWWQADADIRRNFFDKIRAGKVDDAFQFTLDPEERMSALKREEMRMRYGMAKAGQKSQLAQFREHEIVQVIRHGGEETTIKSLGPPTWDYQDKGYFIYKTYRITTAEAVLDVSLGVRSRESREFKGRRWQLLLSNSSVLSGQKSAYGEKIDKWRMEGHKFGANWMRKQLEGDYVGVFLDSREPQDRAHLERQYRLNRAVAVAGCTVAGCEGGRALEAIRLLPLVDSQLSALLYMPGFREFAAAPLVDAQEFEAPKSVKSIMLEQIMKSIVSPGSVKLRPQDDKGMVERLEAEPHHLQVNFNIELAIFEVNNPFGPKYQGQAALVVESDQDPMTSEAPPQWRIVSLKLFSGGLPSSGGGPGMQGMGMSR